MSTISHEYDPVKRREYYLRTRQLVGRNKGSVSIAVPKTGIEKDTSLKKTPAERRTELEARVNRLKARLEQLQNVLKTMVEAAQARSGIDKNSTEKNAAEKDRPTKNTNSTEKKTQKQKDAAAEAAQKYRDEHKSLADQVVDLTNKIEAIREKIKRLRQEQPNRERNDRSKREELKSRVDRSLTTDRLRRSGKLTIQ